MSAQTAATVPGRPFQRGNDPRRNGGGRPKNLATLVARETKNGAELVTFMADVFYARGQFEHGRIPLAARMDAATWLADRLWGKPKQVQEVTGPHGGALTVEVSLAELRERLSSRIAELAPRARARLLPDGADPDESGGAAA